MKCLKCLLPIEDPAKARYGLHSDCFAAWFHVDKNTEFMGLQNVSTSSSSGRDFTPQNDSFFQGKFKKYSAELNGESYIFKMKQTQAPELPDVEYLCNQIAEVLNINVAPFYFIEFNGERVFITKNFVKPELGEDLQHICHFRPDEQHTCEGLIKVIRERTQQPIYVEVLIKTILFDALIGNHDRHGRNLAFIAGTNRYFLSPIYDNVSYLGLESGAMLKADFNPVGKIATQAIKQPNMFNYAKELIRLGYNEKVQEFYRHLGGMAGVQIDNRIDNSFCSALMKDAIKKLIEKRFQELKNALSA